MTDYISLPEADSHRGNSGLTHEESSQRLDRGSVAKRLPFLSLAFVIAGSGICLIARDAVAHADAEVGEGGVFATLNMAVVST